MSGLAPTASHKDYEFTSLVLKGGRDCKPGVILSHQNPDLWVKGGAIIEKGLCVMGNLSTSGVLSGTFVGNVITNNITAENISQPIIINGAVNIPTGNLNVDNKIVAGELCVLGDTTFFGNVYGLNISGNIGNIAGNLNVSGKITAGELCVIGKTTLLDDLTVNGNLVVLGGTILENLTVIYDQIIGGNVIVGGETSTETLTVTQNGEINGNLNVAGKITAGELCVIGETTLLGNVTILGGTTLDTLNVLQDAVINGNLSGINKLTADDLCVTGSTMLFGDGTVNGNLSVLGGTTLDTLNVLQDAIINGNLSGINKLTAVDMCVTGSTMLFGDGTVNGNLNVLGGTTLDTLNVLQDAVINGNLSGINKLTAVDLCVTGSTMLFGDGTVNGNLSVLGETTLDTLNVIQDAVINGNLSGINKLTAVDLCVTGSTMLFGDGTVNGNLNVLGGTTLEHLTVVNDETIGGNLSVSGLTTLDRLLVINDAVIDGNLSGIKKLTVEDLCVTGTTTLLGDQTVAGNLTVGESVLINKEIIVLGDTMLMGNLYVMGQNPAFVHTFSAGTTGLLPATPTMGDIVLSGTLNVDHGGTGTTTFATGALLYGMGTGPIQATSVITYGVGSFPNPNPTITNVPTPFNASDVVPKSYVDAAVANLNVHDSVYVSSKVNLVATYANGALGVGATLTNNTTQGYLVLDTLATTSIAAGSNGASLPQGTIFVGNVSGFPTSGHILIGFPSLPATTRVQYTGVNTMTNSFTGCTGGSGTLSTGDIVVLSLEVGRRVMIKDQTSQIQNGIYDITVLGDTSTNWVLTRSGDFDNSTPGEVVPGDFVFVENAGQMFGSTGWVQTNTGTGINGRIVIGTDNIVFTQFSGAGTYMAGVGLTLTGSIFSITNQIISGTTAANQVPQITYNAQGQITAVSTTILSAAGGGTGLTTTPANGQLLIGTGTGFSLSTLSTGTGISVLNGTGSITIFNTGVTSLASGTAISVSGSTGAVTINNTGVTSFSAGTTGFNPSSPTTGAITLSGVLVAANGGTGYSSYTVGDLLYAGTTSTLSKLADVATGNALISGGVGVAPQYGKIDLTTTVSGSLPVANGGTGVTSAGNGQILIGTGTGFSLTTLSTGTGISVLNGSGSITINNTGVTSFSAGTTGFSPTSATTGAVVLAGTLNPANGGTGISTSASNGQILIGNGTGFSLSTITAGSGISVTNGSGSITVTNTGVTTLVLDTNATPTTYPQDLTKGVWYGLNTKANAFDSTTITIGQNATTSASNAIAIGTGISANQASGFFVLHRGPLAVITNPAGFIAGTNELVELASSIRYKENVRTLEAPAEKIDLLRPVRYTAKPGHGDDREQIGLIAEEVNEIYPEFVTHDQEGLISGLLYDRLVSVLLKEIQQLRERVSNIESRI